MAGAAVVLWAAGGLGWLPGWLVAGHNGHDDEMHPDIHDINISALPGYHPDLSEEQIKRMKWEEAHRRYHEMHKGHEWMHFEMFAILLTTLILAQIVLYLWKKHYFRYYQATTLLGMWVFPFVISLRHAYIRMLAVWALFTLCTLGVTYMATRKPLSQRTPRLVYTYFFGMYKFTYYLSIFGYVLLLADIFGLIGVVEHSILLMFYGLYYAVLSRDFAEICTGRMASTIGYYSSSGIPAKQPNPNICGICGESLQSDDNVEGVYTLECKHHFHEFCIRGWCIVGKKQTCPFCREKVDLTRMFPTPWKKQDVFFAQILDFLRYLVVWQPVIVSIAQSIIWLLGLK